MLKIIRSPDKLALNKNNNSRLASIRNNNSKPASRRNNGDGKVNRFGVNRNDVKHTKKLEKLFESGKSKSEKMSKSWKLAKLGKKLSKNKNLTNSNTMEDRLKFLTSNARITFNRLWLTFTEAPILWHFDLKCHIWIETDTLCYTIDRVLS